MSDVSRNDVKKVRDLVTSQSWARASSAELVQLLQALALAQIAEDAENMSTILGTALGKGSPLVEALRGEGPPTCPSCGYAECRCLRKGQALASPRGVNLIPTTVLQAELRRRGIEERPDNEETDGGFPWRTAEEFDAATERVIGPSKHGSAEPDDG